MVAVKRCQRRSLRAKELRNEALLLSQLHHQNIVSLSGICIEQNEIIVVFEYMRKGSLAAFLYVYGNVSVSLAWKNRLQICIDAARGLHYLHTGAKSRLEAKHSAVYGEFPEKSDVFSFGVVLFEVLCGRTLYDTNLPKHQLLDWASEFIREGAIYQVIDPCLKGRIAEACFKKYMEIACSCVHYNGNERPAMGEVEVTLELALELQEKADF
ncbi:hypothetical protein PTKIN_Ptkin15bG0180500 [Pterospermum kingtungense]